VCPKLPGALGGNSCTFMIILYFLSSDFKIFDPLANDIMINDSRVTVRSF